MTTALDPAGAVSLEAATAMRPVINIDSERYFVEAASAYHRANSDYTEALEDITDAEVVEDAEPMITDAQLRKMGAAMGDDRRLVRVLGAARVARCCAIIGARSASNWTSSASRSKTGS